MKVLNLIGVVLCVALLGGCSGTLNQQVAPVFKTLAQLANTAVADLQVTENVAKAATPPDTDGYNCAAAAVVQLGYIQQVNAAANNSSAGIATAAEMASLFQPGSAQYNEVTNALATGCVAKANDVMGAANVVAAGGVMAILPKILPLATAG